MTDGDVYSREPFNSGSSRVITVSGIPYIPNDKKILFKSITVDGKEACLAVPYDEIYEPDLEDMSSELQTE